MISANELRVGNWITYNPLSVDEGTEIVPLQISCVDKEVGVILDDGFTNCYTWDEILPIPITPEILEKCGFNSVSRNEDGTYNYWSKQMDASVDYEDENLFRYRIHERVRTKSITSLHQLQNLYYALTGTELTYKPNPTNNATDNE